MKQIDKPPNYLSCGTLYGNHNRMEAHLHGKNKIKDAVVIMDKYARQDFNEVRDDGKNCTEREVDPVSSVRFRSEPDHNHNVSMDIEKDIESESNSYVMNKELIIKHEGWERSNLLPKGWMFKQITKPSPNST